MTTTAVDAHLARLVAERTQIHLGYITQERARYQLECRAWSEQGYRPRTCFHGTDQWTDYDNICGACEDGETDEETATRLARDDVDTFVERMDLYKAACTANAPEHLITGLGEWATESLWTP